MISIDSELIANGLILLFLALLLLCLSNVSYGFIAAGGLKSEFSSFLFAFSIIAFIFFLILFVCILQKLTLEKKNVNNSKNAANGISRESAVKMIASEIKKFQYGMVAEELKFSEDEIQAEKKTNKKKK